MPTLDPTFGQILLAIIGAIVTSIGGWYAWQQKKLEIKKQAEAELEDTQQEFTELLIKRVETLELRMDTVSLLAYDTAKKADEDRRRLTDEYEKKLGGIRQDMQKLLDQSALEIATWRDRYYAVLEQFSDLKVKYNELKISNKKIEEELKTLEAQYEQLKELHYSRRYPDIENTSGF